MTSVQPMSENRTVRQDAGSGAAAEAAMGSHASNAKHPERMAQAALDLFHRLSNDRPAEDLFGTFVFP